MTNCINKQLRRKALAYVRDELGTVICWDQEERARAVELLRDAGRVFRSEIMNDATPVVLIYLYRQSEQYAGVYCHNGTFDVDGLATVRMNTRTGDSFSMIGLAVEALHCASAAEYSVLLFLHELCHIIGPDTTGEHSAEFHECLDCLIERYNEATGSAIANDYFI